LFEPPFCTFSGMAAEFTGKFADGCLYRPVGKPQLCEPLEPALNVPTLNQALNCLHRSVLTAHADEYRGNVSPRFCQCDGFVDKGFEPWTGNPFCYYWAITASASFI
jgi:hypothetical protein